MKIPMVIIKFISILHLAVILTLSSGAIAKTLKGSLQDFTQALNGVAPSAQHCTSEEQKWIDFGYANTRIKDFNVEEYYLNSTTKFTHGMELTLVNLRGSGWSEAVVEATIKKVAKVYAQCGIRVSGAKYVEVDPPNGTIDISYKKDEDAHLANMAPVNNRPLLFFARSNVEGNTAYAWSKRLKGPPLRNTMLMTNAVNTKEYKKYRDRNYSPTAHELAHLLCDCDHIKGDEKNILGNSAERVNDKISPEQCSVFKNSSLVKELGHEN